jgi:hypothetical protein
VDAETDASGNIRFEVSYTGPIAHGSITVTVQIYTVVVNDSDALWFNTFDYDLNGEVNPVDFVEFAADFGPGNYDERSDFDWTPGTPPEINPIDFVEFAAHWTHSVN